MNTLSFSQKPLHCESEGDLAPRKPSFSLAGTDSDASGTESDNEVLMNLFNQPGASTSPTSERVDRGGRPFPYTRSKTRWRKRPTDELKYLRSQVAELEKLLARLSCTDGRAKLLGNNEDAGTAYETLRKLRAESHVKKMKAGIAENRRLRSMILTQFQVANALQTAIDEHRRLRTQKMSWPSKADVSDNVIFSLLDEEKEHQYADVDRVLEECGIAQICYPLYSRLVLHRDENTVSFHHNEVRMLPFAMEDVARSLRNCLSHGARVGPAKHCRHFESFGKYFHATTSDSFNMPDNEQAEVKSRVLQLCVPQTERTLVVWSGYAEYSGSKFIRLLEKTYISLEAIPMEKLGMFTMGGRSPGTLMRVAVRLTPVETEYDVQKPEDIEEMADVVVRTYQRKGQRKFQAMLEQLKDKIRVLLSFQHPPDGRTECKEAPVSHLAEITAEIGDDLPAQFEIDFQMTTVQDSSSLQIPSYMAATDSDESNGDDSELLVSLFEQPEPACSVMADVCDRGGRAFPYTRSKTRWRKRPNDELKYLRSQVVELECLLGALHQSGRRPTVTPGRGNQAAQLQKLCEANQSPKVYAALVENRKLRAVVARQLQVVKTLQSTIDEHVRLKAQKLPWPSSVEAPDELMGAIMNEEQQQHYPHFDVN